MYILEGTEPSTLLVIIRYKTSVHPRSFRMFPQGMGKALRKTREYNNTVLLYFTLYYVLCWFYCKK
jgi:hypothetical protein